VEPTVLNASDVTRSSLGEGGSDVRDVLWPDGCLESVRAQTTSSSVWSVRGGYRPTANCARPPQRR
jgi:hypothetical protein